MEGRSSEQFAKLISTAAADFGMVFSLHAEEEVDDENLTVLQVLRGLRQPEVLEVYDLNLQGQRCLALIKCGGQAIHVVCNATEDDELNIVTVYIPKVPAWITARKRGK